MTENEIVQYLKENKNKGVMYIFMPEEVQNWCSYKKEYRSDFLLYRPGRGWAKVSDDFLLSAGYVIALPEDFKLKEKPEGGWVEFEIDKNGDFNLKYDGTEWHEGEDRGFGIHWSNWGGLLQHSIKERWSYTAFGGWQYEGDEGWFMAPCIKTPKNTMYMYIDGESLPAIPTKIRFWREKK